VTTRRVAWKTLLQGAVEIDLAGVSRGQVQAAGTTVTVAGRTVELKDPALASSLAWALAELSGALERQGLRKGDLTGV
jgi:hypothetical protein